MDGDLLSVQYATQRVSTLYSPRGPRGKKRIQANNQTIFPTVYLITPQHYVNTNTSNITGPTPDHITAAHQESLIRSIKRNRDGHVVITTDAQTHAPCGQCGHLDTDTACANTTSCEAWFHKRCLPHSLLCLGCQPPTQLTTGITPLTNAELRLLQSACGTI